MRKEYKERRIRLDRINDYYCGACHWGPNLHDLKKRIKKDEQTEPRKATEV